MNSSLKDKKYEEIILNVDEGNKVCIDCKNTNVTHISINNGVILCPNCALAHITLGPSISYIRLINDEWDEYLFNYVIFGGNTKFANCLKSFSIEDTMEIELKYQTKACNFYRKTLKAKVLGNPLEETIDPSTAKEICVTNETTSEFDNYVIKISKAKSSSLMKVGGFFSSIGKKTWGEMKKAGQFVAEKTAPATDKLKQAGQFVAKKTSPATDKIKQGANFVSSQVQNGFTNIKDKMVGKKNDEENAIEVKINEGDTNIIQNQQQGGYSGKNDQVNIPNAEANEQNKGEALNGNANNEQSPEKDTP